MSAWRPYMATSRRRRLVCAEPRPRPRSGQPLVCGRIKPAGADPAGWYWQTRTLRGYERVHAVRCPRCHRAAQQRIRAAGRARVRVVALEAEGDEAVRAAVGLTVGALLHAKAEAERTARPRIPLEEWAGQANADRIRRALSRAELQATDERRRRRV